MHTIVIVTCSDSMIFELYTVQNEWVHVSIQGIPWNKMGKVLCIVIVVPASMPDWYKYMQKRLWEDAWCLQSGYSLHPAPVPRVVLSRKPRSRLRNASS